MTTITSNELIEKLKLELGESTVEVLHRLDALISRNRQEWLNIMSEKNLTFLKIERSSLQKYSLFFVKGAVCGDHRVFVHLGKRSFVDSGRYKTVTQAVDMTSFKVVALSKIRYSTLEVRQVGRREVEMLQAFVGSERMLSSEYFGERITSSDLAKLYIFAVYCDQGNLSNWIHLLRMVEKISIAVDIVEAVVEFHASGRVHHDIKPSNVLLYTAQDGKKRALLADFGYAKNKSEPMGSSGSISWCAPEKLRKISQHIPLTFEESILTDIWSTGGTLYNLFIDAEKYISIANDMPFFNIAGLADLFESFHIHSATQGQGQIHLIIHQMMDNDPSKRLPLQQASIELKKLMGSI